MASSVADIEATLVDIAARHLRERVERFVEAAEDVYRDAAPNHSGTLAGAWQAEIEERGELRLTVKAGVDDDAAPHGKWINDPVDEIVPRSATVLHWFGYSGDEVFARRVTPSREHAGWWEKFVQGPLADAVRDA